MYLSLRELELRKIPFDVEIAPGQIDFENELEELKQASPLCSQGEAELISDTLGEIRIQGSLQVTMEAPCDRCLEPARFPVRTNFRLFYQPDEPGTGGEKHIGEGEIEIGFYEGDGLELQEILVEQILLALPMQKVCRENCKGICPVCGQNRNQADCTCQSKPVAGHWAEALQNLKQS